jgi:hypothetical protein
MKGIEYVVDEKGNRIAVQIDLKRYSDLVEDVFDVIIARQRANEPTVSWERAKKRLRKKGKS